MWPAESKQLCAAEGRAEARDGLDGRWSSESNLVMGTENYQEAGLGFLLPATLKEKKENVSMVNLHALEQACACGSLGCVKDTNLRPKSQQRYWDASDGLKDVRAKLHRKVQQPFIKPADATWKQRKKKRETAQGVLMCIKFTLVFPPPAVLYGLFKKTPLLPANLVPPPSKQCSRVGREQFLLFCLVLFC